MAAMFVSQEANMKEVARTLQPVCHVVAQVKRNLNICFFIGDSLTAITIRDCQYLAHVSYRHKHLYSGDAMMVL